MKLLPQLKDNARTIVYTMIIAALKADPVLASVFEPGSWQTYTKDPSDNLAPSTSGALPTIEILPYSAGASPLTPVTQASPLGFRVTITTEGWDVRDLLNLWGAVEAAIFKGGAEPLHPAIRAALSANAPGSHFATLQLTDPAITPSGSPGSEQMQAVGAFMAPLAVRK